MELYFKWHHVRLLLRHRCLGLWREAQLLLKRMMAESVVLPIDRDKLEVLLNPDAEAVPTESVLNRTVASEGGDSKSFSLLRR